MPLPKEWAMKPKVKSFPIRIDDRRMCYNCFTFCHLENMNIFSGLCHQCIEFNERNRTKVQDSESVPGGVKCRTCKKHVILNTNFGIVRDTCKNCSMDPVFIQCCISCGGYKETCCNYLCSDCRGGNDYLCEKEGEIFYLSEFHERRCVCKLCIIDYKL